MQTHFGACYSCFKHKLGLCLGKQPGDYIACRIGYHLDDIDWDYIGACAPVSLNSRISGERLAIRRVLLEEGKKFF